MLTTPKASPDPNHDELFIERYQRLILWSLKFTDNNREQAEDLVQDAFVQFTFARPRLDQIQNLDAYLYGMLRHLHLSQVRRATRNRLEPLSILEYESAATGLRSIDPRGQIQVQDELRRICDYACARKETAKAASVLILRFFHGYYPSEIVEILRSSRQAVRERLRIARAEARLALENPAVLGHVKGNAIAGRVPANFARPAADFLLELRQTIFCSRSGDCLSRDQLRALYLSSVRELIDGPQLAHIVSCRDCLDTLNQLLNLPLLAERYPTDAIDKETGRRDGPGGGEGGESVGESIEKCRRRAREAFEHEPQELCVAVNGYMQGSQKISSQLSELTLSVKEEEKISFVEIFSEQDIRLLFMSVDGLPPEGPGELAREVMLSDGRSLALTLRFRSPWPTLYVSYRDPTYSEEVTRSTSESRPLAVDATRPAVNNEISDEERSFLKTWLRNVAGSFNPGLLLRPGMITIAFTVLLLAALLVFQLYRQPRAPLSASQLLEKSAAAELALAARTDTVLHRTVVVEQRGESGELLAKNSIEIWHSARDGVTARRLFDAKGSLSAGEWITAEGARTLYHHGAKPRTRYSPEKPRSLNSDNIWEISLSAAEFIALVRGAENVNVEEQRAQYVLSVNAESSRLSESLGGLVKATLFMSRDDLRAMQLTLVVRDVSAGSRLTEYRFTEVSFERHSPEAIAPAVFEPEAILLGNSIGANTEKSLRGPEAVTASVPVVASRELEVEVLRLLNQAGADLGEQVSVVRSSDDLLFVQAIVETEERKRELQQALAEIARNPAVRLEIATRAEATAKARAQRPSHPAPAITIEEVAPSANSVPVEPELRRYFSAGGLSGEQLENNINRFSTRMLNRSLRMMQRAWALKRLVERFSNDELARLEPGARLKWLAMIREHAQALQQQTTVLRRELSTVFPSPSSALENDDAAIRNDQELVQATRTLFTLCSETDRAVSAAFTVSPNNARDISLKKQQFWVSLRGAESLARRIALSQ